MIWSVMKPVMIKNDFEGNYKQEIKCALILIYKTIFEMF